MSIPSSNEYLNKLARRVDRTSEELGLDECRQALSSSNPLVWWYAVKAVGQAEHVELSDEVFSLMLQHGEALDDSKLRTICARALGQLGLNSFAEHIPEILAQGNTSDLIAVADSLGETGDPRAVPYLEKIIRIGDDDVCLWASLSLYKIGHEGLEAIRRLLEETEPPCSVYLTDALSRAACEE